MLLLGAMSPGPDFTLVLRHAVTSGRAAGVAAAAGIATGVLGWALAAATGVAALVANVPAALLVIRVAGTAYLAYLGAGALWSALRRRPSTPGALPETGASRPGWTAFRDGVLCNVLNPKAAVFFVALAPQFLPDRPTVADSVTVAAIAVTITVAWFATVATLTAAVRGLLSRPRVRRGLDGASGVALLGFSVRLAVTSVR
ncbi:LysE family translocator [Symbioplanes lichenis]|uniref:LysE family translocator n=1 Tax=Symbioplanes lichenis TaxID=1629072 RepID=UPI0027388C0B|nr:LysE family translocator [Actinoplanes lichenis]